MHSPHKHPALAPLLSSTRAFIDRFVTSRVELLLHVGWAVAIAAFLIIALDSMVKAPGRDSSVFIYVAQGLLDGEIPYVDRWDHKGPLIYLLNAAGLFVGGVQGIWVLASLFLIGSSWFAFKTTKGAFGTTAAVISLVIFLMHFPKFAQGGNLTEHYALLFQFSALLLFVRIEHRGSGKDIWPAVAIGMLGAAAFLLRPNLIGVWLAIGTYWLLQRDHGLRWTAWSIVGGLSVLLVVSIVFALAGGWSGLWDAFIRYNFVYVDSSLKDRLKVLVDMRRDMLMLSLPLAASWGIGLHYWITGKARCSTFEHLLPLALILGPIEVVLITVSGFQWTHYYLAIFPVATVLLAFLVKFLEERRFAVPILLLAAPLAALLYYEVPYGHLARLPDKYGDLDSIAASSRHDLVAKRVRQETDPDDLILVWGAETQIYSLSGRAAPTRFFYQYPLVEPSYANDTKRSEFMSDVIDGRPAMIIDTENGRLAPLGREEREGWRPSDKRYLHDPDAFQPFFDFLDTEYAVIDEVSGYTLYGLRGRE